MNNRPGAIDEQHRFCLVEQLFVRMSHAAAISERLQDAYDGPKRSHQ